MRTFLNTSGRPQPRPSRKSGWIQRRDTQPFYASQGDRYQGGSSRNPALRSFQPKLGDKDRVADGPAGDGMHQEAQNLSSRRDVSHRFLYRAAEHHNTFEVEVVLPGTENIFKRSIRPSLALSRRRFIFDTAGVLVQAESSNKSVAILPRIRWFFSAA